MEIQNSTTAEGKGLFATKEYKRGEIYVNRAQSIAVAYGQVQKKHPSCKKHLKKVKFKTN